MAVTYGRGLLPRIYNRYRKASDRRYLKRNGWSVYEHEAYVAGLRDGLSAVEAESCGRLAGCE